MDGYYCIRCERKEGKTVAHFECDVLFGKHIRAQSKHGLELKG